jgi:PKD repeat protein
MLSFEYSTDNGITWQSLPTGSVATSWDNPWSGSSGGWIPVANTVPDLGGWPNVKFRFSFNTILSDNEGIAIDDIQISDCVAGMPTADFSYTQDTTHVQFTNNSSNATSYYWDFGDLQTSTDPNPAHDYLNISNSYTVMLVAMNDCNSDTTYQTITVVGNDIAEIDNQVSIYPNPAQEKVWITAPVTGILSLTDLTGKTILKTVFVNQKEINLKGISKGIYLLSIENEKQSLKRKLVVE